MQVCTQDIPQIIILFLFAYKQKITMFLKMFSVADCTQDNTKKYFYNYW